MPGPRRKRRAPREDSRARGTTPRARALRASKSGQRTQPKRRATSRAWNQTLNNYATISIAWRKASRRELAPTNLSTVSIRCLHMSRIGTARAVTLSRRPFPRSRNRRPIRVWRKSCTSLHRARIRGANNTFCRTHNAWSTMKMISP